jgi:predicted nucleic acid-binding protein
LEREEIRKYVLDSSVAVKWFVDEKGSDKARALKDHFVNGSVELVAPDLLKYEVANALRWHPTVPMDQLRVSRAISAIAHYQFLIDPPKDAWIRAAELSYSSGVSLYDSIYLGLALALKSKLITADEKLIEAFPPPERENTLSLAKVALE